MSTPPGQWGQPQQPQYPQQQPPPQQPWGQPQDQQQQQQWGQPQPQQQQWGQPQYQQHPGQAMQPQYGMQQGYGMPGVAAPMSSAGKRFGAYLLEALLMIVTLYIGWIIWALIVWGKGQSPAKQMLGMRAARLDTGWGATWGTMALRELVGKWLLGFVTFGITSLVSCFMILGESRQGIWDKVANTVIVDDPDGRLLPR